MERPRGEGQPKIPWGRLVEDYSISLQMVQIIEPSSELHKWHMERMNNIANLFTQEFGDQFTKKDDSGKIGE